MGSSSSERSSRSRKIAPQNSRRTLRALTVISRTGKLFSEQQRKINPRYDALILGLNSDREEVYQRIICV